MSVFGESASMGNRKVKKVQGSKMMGVWLLLLFLFVGELLLYTWCRVQCVRTGYEISDLAKKNRDLTALQKGLRVELARLKSPDRIAKIAQDRLGLIMPNAKHTIVIP
jgi:cell division protein FtsL